MSDVEKPGDNDNVVTLGSKRVEKTHNCKDWTVEDALLHALEEVRANRDAFTSVYIALKKKESGDSFCLPRVIAGLSTIETAGLLQLHLSEYY